MNHIQKSVLALATLLSSTAQFAFTPVATYYSARPQSTDSVREAVGFEYDDRIYRSDVNNTFNGAWAIGLQYEQTFNPGDIARSLFGESVSCNSSCGSTINISGSLVANRGRNDWLADYFGLAQDYQGTVTFKPRVQNVVADVEFYFGLDQWARGLYARLNLPIVWTKWDLHVKQNVCNPGSCALPQGYFAQDTVPFDDLLGDALSFFSGNSAPTLSGASDETATDAFGNINTPIFDKLRYAKWATSGSCDCNDLSKTRLAAVEMVLGYNFLLDDDYYFGLNIRSSAPTGNAPKGEFLFEPIVGNGKHWELGGGLDAHYVFWRSEDNDDKTFSFYLDANVVHLFGANQCRTFDLCGSNNSRYMLAQKMMPSSPLFGTTPTNDNTNPADITPSVYQFAGEFAPVANLTASKVSVSSAVMGDVLLKFTYANGNGLHFDFGYNFWARSAENIHRKGFCGSSDPLDGTTWGLKGDAFVYAVIERIDEERDASDGAAVALGATESMATIFNGTNVFNTDVCLGTDNDYTINAPYDNPGIDNPAFAVYNVDGTDVSLLMISNSAAGGADAVQQQSSNQQVMLSRDQLDLSGLKGLSNRVFLHLDYAWNNHDNWAPFIGIGATAEFGQSCNGFNFDCSSSSGSNCSPCSTGTLASTDNLPSSSSSSSACGFSSGCGSSGSVCGDSSSGCGTSCGSSSNVCSSSSSDRGSFKAALNKWSCILKGGISWN